MANRLPECGGSVCDISTGGSKQLCPCPKTNVNTIPPPPPLPRQKQQSELRNDGSSIETFQQAHNAIHVNQNQPSHQIPSFSGFKSLKRVDNRPADLDFYDMPVFPSFEPGQTALDKNSVPSSSFEQNASRLPPRPADLDFYDMPNFPSYESSQTALAKNGVPSLFEQNTSHLSPPPTSSFVIKRAQTMNIPEASTRTNMPADMGPYSPDRHNPLQQPTPASGQISNGQRSSSLRQRKPRGGNDPLVKSKKVFGLNEDTFTDFVNRKDAAMVMFYDCDMHKCLPKDEYSKKHFMKAADQTERDNHAFATIDCSRDQELCKKEAVPSFPFFRLYSRGATVSSIRDFAAFDHTTMTKFVQKAPVLDRKMQGQPPWSRKMD